MKACEGRQGRVFVLRLEDDDVIPACIERFAAEQEIDVGQVILVGGVGGGEIVAGPRDSVTMPPQPMLVPLNGAHEVVAVGLLAPDEKGRPVLHMHGAFGRSAETLVGCMRPGLGTWLVGEAVIQEFIGVAAARRPDERSGFTLLEI